MADRNLDVCAHLVRIAHLFRGSEDSRYYLKGARIEPCAEGGVVIAATNGQILIALHDEDGRTPRPVTLRLRKPVLRSWGRWQRQETRLRMHLADEATTASAEIAIVYGEGNEQVVAIAPNPEVGGVYPDWRRVVPGVTGDPIMDAAPALLSGQYLSRFAEAAIALGHLVDPIYTSRAFAIHSTGPEAPSFIRFAKGIPGFGVIMPIKEDATVPAVPIWARNSRPVLKVVS